MLKINDKTFLNIQEAVQWLMDNNALPFQCTANYAANTEIGLGTIVNPTMAKVRIGSLIFFADSKVSTVTGVTSNGFIVSDQYNDLVDDVVYVSNVQINASGHLIVTLSNGTQIDAGLIKQVASFSIDGSQHLIATYNDGSTNDLGAIFSGSISIAGNITATGSVSGNNVSANTVSVKSLDDKDGQGYIEVLKPFRSLENIADSQGRLRFVEGDITQDIYANFTKTYGKYSLSGTHLMIVLAGKLPSGLVLNTTDPWIILCKLTLPSWISLKITAVDGLVDVKSRPLNNTNNIYQTQTNVACYLNKTSMWSNDFIIYMQPTENITLNQEVYLRVAFDLLIDND